MNLIISIIYQGTFGDAEPSNLYFFETVWVCLEIHLRKHQTLQEHTAVRNITCFEKKNIENLENLSMSSFLEIVYTLRHKY